MSASHPHWLNSPNTLLVLDWDGTVASSDTLALIAPSPDALKPYTDAYVADLKARSDKFGERDSLERVFHWLDSLTEVEYASVKRVEQGGLFKGMHKSALLDRARDTTLLDLQKGIVDLLKSFQGTWAIISVGWSGEFIRAALESRGVDTTSKQVQILANEVEFDAGDKGTGRISKHKENSNGIRVARDKKREMQRMVDKWQKDVSNGTVVYVGDSETDLMALLDADLGIIMNSPKMVKQCKSLGLEVQDDGALPDSDASRGVKPRLCHLRDFTGLV